MVQGRPSPDLDFATSAPPAETTRLLRGWAERKYLVGVAFGTVGALKDGERLEITTYRKEVYAEEHRKPSVTFGDDILVDLSRRDFTINAMAVRLPDGEFIDPYGGLKALAAEAARHAAGSRDVVLRRPAADDPRRAVRRAARSATGRPCGRSDARAREPARDRVGRADPRRARQAPRGGARAGRSRAAGRHRARRRFLPELPALSLEQDPVHRHKDVLRHTYAVVDRCEPDLVLRLAALLHDVGKPATREDHARGCDVPPSRGRGRADRRGCG